MGVFSKEAAALVLVGFAVGGLAGVIAAVGSPAQKNSGLSADMDRAQQRIAALEMALAQKPTNFASLESFKKSPLPTAPAFQQPTVEVPSPLLSPSVAPTEQAVATSDAPALLKPALAKEPSVVKDKPVVPAPAPTKVIANKPTPPSPRPTSTPVAPARPVAAVVAPIAPAVSSTPAVLPKPAPANQPASAAQVARSDVGQPTPIGPVPADLKIEAVTSSKARVSKISAQGVYLANGDFIQIGQRFSTGEQLLKVDPASNKITTNERHLVIFFGQ